MSEYGRGYIYKISWRIFFVEQTRVYVKGICFSREVRHTLVEANPEIGQASFINHESNVKL